MKVKTGKSGKCRAMHIEVREREGKPLQDKAGQAKEHRSSRESEVMAMVKTRQ
jgi:hypothetical protein